MDEHGRITVQNICRRTGANRNTIKVHLKELVRKKQRGREGVGKSSWYRL